MGTVRCVTIDWSLKRSLYLSDHQHLSLRHNTRVYHSIILCTDVMDGSVVDLSGFFAKECRDRDATELIHVKETSQIY